VEIDRRWALLIGLAAIVAVVAVVTAIVLSTDDDGGGFVAVPTTTSTSAPPAVTDPPAAPVEATDLEDGRHPAYITALDVDAGTVEVDVIQFLTGEEARVAYEQETGDPGGPPNDYYIKNENSRLRTLPVAADVRVTVVDPGADSRPSTFGDLPALFATRFVPDGGRLTSNPFWLTLEDGTVTAMEEQYLP
jgi:hypothetical protein